MPPRRWAVTRRPQCLRRARTSSNPTGRRPHPGRPRACLGQGEGGRAESRSWSPPCRPPISPSLAEARPAPNGKAPLPAQKALHRGLQDGPAASPPTVRRKRPQPVHWGLRPPARTALPPPARLPRRSMRAAASLPVKVSPGPSCRTPRRPGEAEREGGMQGKDLTPSLREDGHPSRSPGSCAPAFCGGPDWGQGMGGVEEGVGNGEWRVGRREGKLAGERKGVGEEQRREEGERTSCQRDPFLLPAVPHPSSKTSLREIQLP